MKKGFNRLTGTPDASKERISKFEYRSVEITLTETQQEKMREKKM